MHDRPSNIGRQNRASTPRPHLPVSQTFLAGTILALAIGCAWHGSFSVPFLLDDFYNVVANPTLRKLGHSSDVFFPSDGIGVGGRPALNLSFALNYAAGGLDVRGYHAVNLLIHFCASVTLFALIRRTLLTPSIPSRFSTQAFAFALTVSLLWSLHPVQTQAVTYLSQRAESLMGFFYLLTLYLFLRGCTSAKPLVWQVGTVATCLVGMATKEVMVTAPVILLFYDRTFLAGSFRAALRARVRLYSALAATWIVLAVLMADVSARGIGPAHGVDWFSYALTECRVVLRYLRLAVLPSNLIFDYTTVYVHSLSDVKFFVSGVVALLGLTVVALVRWPMVGFVGAWFFIVLAPTSSVVPVALSPVAESRLYLPLIAVLSGFVLLLHAATKRHTFWVVIPLAVCLAVLAERRNHLYRSAETIWADTIAKQPDNARAYYNLGLAFIEQNRLSAAIPALETVLRLQPDHPSVEHLLANAFAAQGDLVTAVTHYQNTLRLHPEETAVRTNLANALLKLGRHAEAEEQSRLAVRQRPRDPIAHHTLALVFEQRGQSVAALASYDTALRLDPNQLPSRLNAGNLLIALGRFQDALPYFERLIGQDPSRLDGHRGRSQILIATGRANIARQLANDLIQRFPDSPDLYFLLGSAEMALDHAPAAIAALQRALQLRPQFPEAQSALARLHP